MRTDSFEKIEQGYRKILKASLTLVSVVVALLVALGFGSTAQAAELEKFCATGSEAGQCKLPRGVAADPRNGHVFIADQVNRRVVEFNALGQFIKTWGWDVVESGPGDDTVAPEDEFEICIPNDGDVCKAGISGAGVGQFSVAQGVALDSSGNVYVVDWFNFRVQKFDPEGNFLLMFGDEVDQGPNHFGDLCTAQYFEEGDVCGAGTQGNAGKAQFAWPVQGSFLAITRDDKVYVGDEGRIQRFDAEGHYIEDWPDLDGALIGETVSGLATDSAGDLYAIYSGKADVRKLTLAGVEREEPRFRLLNNEEAPIAPTAVTVDSVGHVFAFGQVSCCGGQDNMDPIVEFDETGKVIAEFGQGEFNASTGLATNLCAESEAPGNLYVSNSNEKNAFVRVYGTEPVGCFKARTGKASSITETTARLNGTVDPDGALSSECRFEYGPTDTYGQVVECAQSSGEIGEGNKPVPVHADISGLQRGTVYHFRLLAKVGGELETGSDEEFKTVGPPVISADHTAGATDTQASVEALVNPEGFAAKYHFEYGLDATYGKSTPEIAIGSDRNDHAAAATLEGLSPGTTYHWRIVATNAALGNPVVFGADHTVTTYRSAGEAAGCPNQALRTGPSAFLPDCRAYEMVSPVDKNGGDIVTKLNGTVDAGGYMQASPDGDKIAYTALTSFGDQANSFNFNQYVASRAGMGWTSAGIHPPVEGSPVSPDVFGVFREFMAFTPDLCKAWLIDFETPPLTNDGQGGQPNLYRRENCGAGTGNLEALTPEPPALPEGTPQNYVDSKSVQGISEDGRHAFFVAQAGVLQQCRTTNTTATIAYQWLRNGAPIDGATSPVYAASATDAGKALQCRVTAISANAGSTQVANPATIIPSAPGVELSPPVAPANIFAPAQSGTLTVGGPGGQTLTCNPQAAEWQGSPAFTYQWHRNGVPIAGATSSTYLVSTADLASAAVFQCAVTGTNADGAVTKVSAHRATSPAPSPPAQAANASMGSGGVFDRSGGENHLVSVLPNGRPAEANSAVGGSWDGNLDNAVSTDGSRVYWSAGGNKLYLRENAEQGVGAGECVEAGKACTRELTKPTSGSAVFWAATPDGSKALFGEATLGSQGEGLFEFDLQKAREVQPSRREIASNILGVAGQSEDLSHIYFVSREALTGAQENSEKEAAQAGAPNLYLDEEGTLRFVATLSEKDLGVREPGATIETYNLVRPLPYLRATRVSADGSRIVFDSRGELTGFDNSEAESGKPAIEVFSYGAEDDQLVCVSCNPSEARPVGRELREPYAPPVDSHPTKVIAAAWIPTWEHSMHASNVLSGDGGRIFFNSIDPLLPRDGNGAQDVYEWEEAGVGGCKENSPSYFSENGGCLYLISSAESSHEAEFWEASPDGEDVFFTTVSSLLPHDPGLVDLYDARVKGGFPQPIQPGECEGEACQSPPPAPEFGPPASSAFTGPPNPKGKKRRCPSGKHKVRRKGKARCVRNGKKHKRQRAQSNRRAGR